MYLTKRRGKNRKENNNRAFLITCVGEFEVEVDIWKLIKIKYKENENV